MRTSGKKDEPYLYFDMCLGMLSLTVSERSDFVLGQLIAVAGSVLLALLIWSFFGILPR
jgi:hypothetical protein